MGIKYTGKYTQAFLSDKKMKANSIEADFFNKKIEVKPNEALYIYSFKGNKMLFTKGFEAVLNKKDNDISIVDLNSMHTPHFEEFMYEFNDRLLLFLYNNNENIETFSSNVIIKIKGVDTALMLNTKVYKTDENGNLISIIGRNTLDKKLNTTDVIQYSLIGDFKEDFLDTINNDLNFTRCISLFNIKIISLFEEGKQSNEVSKILNISEEKINTNIEKLLKRFELLNLNELIEFSKSNCLIPSQFDNY
jgi:DNA-binding CsgD family transcriptional regulator